MKKLLVAAMSFSLLAIAAAPVAAQDNPAGTGVSAAGDVQPAFVLSNKKQTKVTFDQLTALVAIPNGVFGPMDGAKVLNCGTTSCVISADITVQVCPIGTADVPIALRFVVDGGAVTGSDLFVTVMDSAENDFYCDMGTTRIVTPVSLGPGNHTVQTFIYAGGTANRNYYNVKYSQFKP